MSAEEWAEAIVKARQEYTFTTAITEEQKWKERVAFTSGCVHALARAGIVDIQDLSNALAHRCGDL